MSAETVAVATIPSRYSLVAKFASKFSIEPERLLPILKATAFKQRDGEVSNEQMAALLVVADQYGLNPFTREIFAFPDKQNGIVPVVGVDGWSRIVNDHAQSDGFEFRQSTEMKTMPDAQPCPEWIEVVIYRKDRGHPIIVREYLDEVYRPSFTRSDGSKVRGPWQSHTKRFLRHKVFIQGARIAYGFGGIYDEDEAERIIERDITPLTTERSATARLKDALAPDPQDEALRTAAEGVTPQAGAENAATAQPSSQAAQPKARGTPRQRKQFLALMEAAKSRAQLDEALTLARRLEWSKPEADEIESTHAALAKALPAPSDDLETTKAEGTLEVRERIIAKIKACKKVDKLDEEMDVANSYRWTQPDLDVLNACYVKRREELGG